MKNKSYQYILRPKRARSKETKIQNYIFANNEWQYILMVIYLSLVLIPSALFTSEICSEPISNDYTPLKNTRLFSVPPPSPQRDGRSCKPIPIRREMTPKPMIPCTIPPILAPSTRLHGAGIRPGPYLIPQDVFRTHVFID